MRQKAHCAGLAAQQQLELQEAHSARHNSELHAPLPNLFKATFEQAQRLSPGEQWLQQRVEAFDAGGLQQRKQVLQEFLEYVSQSNTSGMEELFSKQAHLFFIRLAAWFSVTLPTLFELPLQLKVFVTFLEFREQAFIRSFFESGVVVPLMQSLSDDDFDIPDEVRCLVLVVLQKLAANGRHHKELLCAKGLIGSVLACISDALKWETLKCAGRLLCELFLSNPQYQVEVLDALQELMTKKVVLTQRVGVQAVISLLVGDQDTFSPQLCEPARHSALIKLSLNMLESQDLRVSADAHCLLCRLVRLFNCDELLFDFGRGQLRSEKEIESEWFRIEVEGHEQALRAPEEMPLVGGRHNGTFNIIHRRVSEVLTLLGGAVPLEGLADGQEFVRRVERFNAEVREAFRAEAGYILKWSLLLYLARRNQSYCTELVDKGLTETLLMSLLDVSHPVRQAAALAELHHLRLLSPPAQKITQAVLVKEDLLSAVSLDQFLALASTMELSKARYRLRNLQSHGRSKAFSAKEHDLHLQISEKYMADAYGIRVGPPVCAFLTEAAEPEAAEGDGEQPEDAVPRSGPNVYGVKRVPRAPDAGDGPPGSRGRPTTSGSRYSVDRGEMEELPGIGLLSNFMTDPMDAEADDMSPLIQEVRSIEGFIGLGAAKHGPADLRSTRRSRLGAEPRPSHRPSVQHRRALALRPVPPQGVEPRRPARSVRPLALSRASSEFTEVSLVCGGNDLSVDVPAAIAPESDLDGPQVSVCSCHRQGARGHAAFCQAYSAKGPPQNHMTSLAETSVGPEQTISDELSRELLSREIPSFSHQDSLPVEDSRMTLATDSLQMPSTQNYSTELPSTQNHSIELLEEDSAELPPPPRLVERNAMTAVVEVPREGRAAALSSRPQRRVVQVASPPYHDCVAFDRSDIELDRHRALQEARGIIHPVTQRRFKDLRAVGPFPRKGLGAAIPFPSSSLRSISASPRDGPRASKSLSAAGSAAVERPMPLSAREPRSTGAVVESTFELASGGSAAAFSDGAAVRSAPQAGLRIKRGSALHKPLLPEVYPEEKMQPLGPAKLRSSLRDFFPASARALVT